MRPAILLIAAVVAIGSPIDAQLRQAPAPRTRPPQDVDPLTAAIAGRVTTADTSAPIRGAEVRAMSEGGINRLVTTAADGSFEIRDLPAGTFRVAVSKSGFVPMQFGQRRPTEAPATIDLARGQRATANVALLRGGVIAGRVFDRFGEPVAGIRVQALRPRMVEGQRRLQAAGAGDETDDTGSFRVYGLAPGDYYVIARPPQASVYPAKGAAPIFYPGTADFTEAQRITVTAASEANALIQLVPLQTFSVSGVVLGPDGPPVDATISLTSQALGLGYVNAAQGEVPFSFSTHVEPDGRFELTGVPPGPYSLEAHSIVTGVWNGRGFSLVDPKMTHTAASAPVVVTGGDVAGLALTLSAGGTITGTFVRDSGASQPLPEGLGVRATGTGMSMMNTGPNGQFRLMNVIGPVRLFVEGLPDGWMVRSIVANDMDVTDRPIELTNGQDATVRIVVTDRITEVTGTVSSREPLGTQRVVVFADDPARWTYPTRFVASARVDGRGTFRIAGLPPGERYLATAVEFLEEGETQDPDVLERLRTDATAFTLSEGERLRIDLQTIDR